MTADTRFCHRCGTALPDGATFCPKCGTPVLVGESASPATAPQGYRYRHEKREKNEKREKHEKSEKGEKGRSGDLTGPVVGGLILIWLGVTFYLEQIGYLSSSIWWAYFISGLGAILVFQGVLMYSRGRRGTGPVIGGAILIFLGLTSIANYQFNFQGDFWPLILVALGVAVIVGGISSRRRVPSP
ncbi:MAG: zinc-ribbon domain-containing protein [Thaumarchaeota archaeon]|nr:zinc-ribbon domain-containing protein [Nitrososphaerota archaeon]